MLITWAAGVPVLDVWIDWARQQGVDPGGAFDMQRTTPAGEVLQWRLTMPPLEGDGVLPFLIEWPGKTPAANAAHGCSLMSLELRHPDPAIGSRLAEYAVPVDVEKGEASLTATIFTPNGVVILES